VIRAALAYGIYRFLLFPVAFFVLHLGLPFWPQKIRVMIEERRGRKLPPLLSSPIWIHASSGEVEYAKPVIRELKTRYPELPILVTYFSPSAKKLMQNFSGVDLLLPLPWDRPREVAEFLNFYRPLAGLFARTDVWPTLATEAHRRKIPLLLFAATLSAESSRSGWGSASLSRWAFSRLSKIFCVTRDDADEFEEIGSGLPIEIAGDTRYDQVFARLEEASRLPSVLAPSESDFIFVAGSTWPEDEEVLIPALADLSKSGVRTILVPHEVDPSHLRSIEDQLLSKKLAFVRLSEAKTWPIDTVLLVDQVGKLADLYRWGHVAFVGGSFREKVHSVMEPLAAGLPVLVGPHHLNNREALQFQAVRLAAGETAVRQIENPRELRDRVLFWKEARVQQRELSELTRKRTGASRKVLEWVEKSVGLPKTAPVQSLNSPLG
jgi:3-deoxy-D-manno-octulosonic-acid transferase